MWFWFKTLAIIGVMFLSGCGQDISGKYLAKFPDGVMLLQLVETPGHQLIGQIDSVTLRGNGSINSSSTKISGTINGKDISLSMSMLGIFSKAASGTVESGKISLLGLFDQQIVTFEKSDLNQYNLQVEALQARSQQALATKADAQARAKAVENERNILGEARQLSVRIDKFNTSLSDYFTKLPEAEQRYQVITKKMQEYFEKQQKISGDQIPQISARHELASAIREGLSKTNSIHNDVTSFENEFLHTSEKLSSKTNEITAACKQISTSSLECEKLQSVLPRYYSYIDGMTKLLARLDATFKREIAQQKKIEQASSKID